MGSREIGKKGHGTSVLLDLRSKMVMGSREIGCERTRVKFFIEFS